MTGNLVDVFLINNQLYNKAMEFKNISDTVGEEICHAYLTYTLGRWDISLTMEVGNTIDDKIPLY